MLYIYFKNILDYIINLNLFLFYAHLPKLFLAQYHIQILEMETEMLQFNASAGLFEVNLPDFKQLKQCRREIVLLKQLWDYVFNVRTSFTDWKTKPWAQIDCEQMEVSFLSSFLFLHTR